jgi:hypothetical protein
METLEEFAQNYSCNNYSNHTYDAVLATAKWQEKRMYSEEDIRHLEWLYNRLIYVHNENENLDYMIKFKLIINKFKKQ